MIDLIFVLEVFSVVFMLCWIFVCLVLILCIRDGIWFLRDLMEVVRWWRLIFWELERFVLLILVIFLLIFDNLEWRDVLILFVVFFLVCNFLWSFCGDCKCNFWVFECVGLVFDCVGEFVFDVLGWVVGFSVGICDVDNVLECLWFLVGDFDLVGDEIGFGKFELVVVIVFVKGFMRFFFCWGDCNLVEVLGLMGIFEVGVGFGFVLNFLDVCFVICSGWRRVLGFLSDVVVMRFLRFDREFCCFFFGVLV